MAAACACASLPLQARSDAAIGPVYPISEPDMVDEIKSRLRRLADSGELAAIEARAQERARTRIETPLPVPGLRKVQVARSYHFDPSVRFDEPVRDASGRVLVAAGRAVNPLTVVRLRQTLFLFDARDPAQVALAKAEARLASGTQVFTPILVGGSPAALSRAWGRPVFFDQAGQIVRRFGIHAVPARVTQDGLMLLVQELVAP